MTDLVTFATDQLGRTEARLGDRLVGMIETWPAPRGTNLGIVRAVYQIYLPIDGAVPPKRPASSITAARRGLLQWLAGWFNDAGAPFLAITEAIVIQAMQETDLSHERAFVGAAPDSVNAAQGFKA